MTTGPFVVGVTGSRHGLTDAQLVALPALLRIIPNSSTLLHGGCAGVDEEIALIAKRVGFARIECYPASDVSPRWKSAVARQASDLVYPPSPAIERNRAIVNRCDVLLAFPATDHDERRSGTCAAIRYARRVGRLGTLVTPSGSPRGFDWNPAR